MQVALVSLFVHSLCYSKFYRTPEFAFFTKSFAIFIRIKHVTELKVLSLGHIMLLVIRGFNICGSLADSICIELWGQPQEQACTTYGPRPNVARGSFLSAPQSTQFCLFSLTSFENVKTYKFLPLNMTTEKFLARHEIWVVHPCSRG